MGRFTAAVLSFGLVGAGIEVQEKRRGAHYEPDGTWEYPTVEYGYTAQRGPKKPEQSAKEPRGLPIPWSTVDPATLNEKCRAHTKFNPDCGGCLWNRSTQGPKRKGASTKVYDEHETPCVGDLHGKLAPGFDVHNSTYVLCFRRLDDQRLFCQGLKRKDKESFCIALNEVGVLAELTGPRTRSVIKFDRETSLARSNLVGVVLAKLGMIWFCDFSGDCQFFLRGALCVHCLGLEDGTACSKD